MDIRDYVRSLRDNFFQGNGKTIYINHRGDFKDFIEDYIPSEIQDFDLPDISEMTFPIAIVYSEDKAFWVDSSEHLWSCGINYCRFIVSKDWLPS